MAAKVYFTEASIDEGEQVLSEKARRLFLAGKFGKCFQKGDFTAVKVHVGEEGNTTYIKAPCLKGLVEELQKLKTKPFITDTSTLYTGRRHNAIDHTILATDRGFGVLGLGIPFLAPDGLFGTAETPVRIDGELEKEVSIAADIVRCQSILSVAHFTGHCATCAGATLKTLGMGCASRKGKMRQHSALKPKIKKGKCARCGVCESHCPTGAITRDKLQAHIDQDKCIGCAECVAMCRFDAVEYDWKQESEILQKSVAEHALGVLRGKEGRAVFFNFLVSMTRDCDCFDQAHMPTMVPDIGIVASTDPVAVDRAAIEMVETRGGQKLATLIGNARLDWRFQIEHAVRIGLGRAEYECIEVS
ncbi:MAG: DUF362 domain-containing protein [Planctomycetes bacterium]|nr:DUF362 domain-containing protein [Planctomycetota bacterium]